jgi:hypothetical protein
VSREAITPEAAYAAVVETFLSNPYVTQASDEGRSRGRFGSSALRINNRIFAMLSSRQEFVVKLPRARVDELIAAGEGKRFDPGHGRLMKEWLAVEAESRKLWLALAREAMEFVASQH